MNKRYLISNIKLEFDHTSDAFRTYLIQKLRIQNQQIKSIQIYKRSVDARKKPSIFFVYSLIFETLQPLPEQKIKQLNITEFFDETYEFPHPGSKLNFRPIIVGTGPAGLFCALVLARNGFRPIVLERGETATKRLETIVRNEKSGQIDFHSNIQFGEGGAGTFSDGKLNTGVKDPNFRRQFILQTLVEHGGDESILYLNKPHVGTDYLVKIVESIRNEILELGGEVLFNTCVDDLLIDGSTSKIKGVHCTSEDKSFEIQSDAVVLAIGHSSRDTFRVLKEKGIDLEAKPFAIGVRIEHPQQWINYSQYGQPYENKLLPVADYKLTFQSSKGRGVYSFCMCPGGYVVNASSHPEQVVCNGMSYFARGSKNANSAIISTVTRQDYINLFPDKEDDPLVGMYFQEHYEHKAFLCSKSYALPTQSYGDFYNTVKGQTKKFNETDRYSIDEAILPSTCKSPLVETELSQCLPEEISMSIIEGIESFGRQIKGFDHPKARLIGVETRTSSPIKILRNDSFMSNVTGLMPCGEGAGYAGGIMSAAIDGIKVAEKLVEFFMINT